MDAIAFGNLPFFQDPYVSPRVFTGYEFGDYPLIVKTVAEFVTGLPRYGHLYSGRPDFKYIPDPDKVVCHPGNRKILPKHSPFPIQLGIQAFPIRVLVRRKEVTGLVFSAVVLRVGYSIGSNLFVFEKNGPVYGLLKNPGEHLSAPVFNIGGIGNICRNDLHPIKVMKSRLPKRQP